MILTNRERITYKALQQANAASTREGNWSLEQDVIKVLDRLAKQAGEKVRWYSIWGSNALRQLVSKGYAETRMVDYYLVKSLPPSGYEQLYRDTAYLLPELESIHGMKPRAKKPSTKRKFTRRSSSAPTSIRGMR